MKFVIVSSDVVYPSGEMKDYERSSGCPSWGSRSRSTRSPATTTGTTRSKGFTATFFSPRPRARRSAPGPRPTCGCTRTTDAGSKARRRGGAAARASTACRPDFSGGPISRSRSDRFALIAVDTGIVKRIDEAQWKWLEAALERARGKFTMALLGHPFYAEAYDMATGTNRLRALNRLLASMA